MDLEVREVEKALENPEKRDDMIKKIQDNTKTITDENGETFKILQLKDITVTPDMLLPADDMKKIGLRFRDCTETNLRQDDVILISFPKTGNHWVSNLIHYLLKTGPLADQCSLQPPLIDMSPADTIDTLRSPRIMCTHHKPQAIPQDIFKGTGRAILLFRNPKDVAVSHFHHLRKMKFIGQMNLSWNCFIEHWMKAMIPRYYFFDYYNAWQREIEENKEFRVLVVNYEDLKRNGVQELRRIQEYLGVSHDDARLQQVLDMCDIDKLRDNVNSGKVKSPLVDEHGKSLLYRKGVIGDWKTHFTVEQNELMDAVIADKFKNTMFKFQY